jgi:hypothetical protein
MSTDFLAVASEVEMLENMCLEKNTPFIDGLLVALGVPESELSSDNIKPVKFLYATLTNGGEMSPTYAATLIIKSLDGILAASQEIMVE